MILVMSRKLVTMMVTAMLVMASDADSDSGDATTSADEDEVVAAWHGYEGGDGDNDDAATDNDDW